LLHRFAVSTLVLLVFQGCSSRPEDPRERTICVSETATVGSRIRVQDGFVAPADAPYFIVTRIDGRGRACGRNKQLPIVAHAVLDTVTPTSGASATVQTTEKRICVVENSRVARPDFLDAYRAALEKKGYAVTVVQKNPQPSQCPLTTRYSAQYGSNVIAYLELYREGKPAGRATYRGRSDDAEQIVRGMIDQLLP